jgi:conjugal transfer mating pair stabilization protein TraG
MASFDVYAYFNVDQLATLMDGIAAITASGDFLDVFRLVAMLAFLVFIAGMATGKSQDPIEFFRWLLMVVIIHSLLLVPKADVVLIDRTGTSPPTVRSNVPIGLAFFASVTSHVGDTLTRTFETVFALPNDLQFQKNGIMFGNTVLVDTLQTVPTNTSFRDDLISFINSCTYYDIINGRISQDVFARADDAWTVMSNTSNTLSARMSTSPTGSMVCAAAYTDLNNRWGAEITQTMQTRGRVLNPHAIDNVVAGAALSSQITSTYTQLTNIAKSATDMLRQNMTLNSVRDSQMVSAQHLDAPSAAIVAAAQSQAEMTANTNYLTMARVAERAAPVIRNVIELICYAVFPLVILLLIVAGEHAGKILKAYVMSLVWVQLIPPLYAILNFAMTTASRSTLVGVAESTTTAAAVNLVNIGQMSQRGLSESAMAGYLTLCLPLIAYALVKGGEIGGSALFSAAMGPAKGGVDGSAGSVATGNISQGNVSLDTTASNNVNSNHYDTAPSMASGFSRVSSAAGTSIFGQNGEFRFQGNQSTLGLSANFGQKIGNALSSEAGQREESAIRETAAATQMRTAALVERMGIVKAFSDQHGTNNLHDASRGTRSGMAVSQLQQIAENVNEKLGLSASSSVGQRIVGTLATGGRASVEATVGGGLASILPVSGKASVSAETSINSQKIDDASKQKTFDAAVAYAKDQLQSRNVTSEQALSADFRTSEAYQWGQQNRTESVKGEEAAMTSATQHTRNAESARSKAFALSQQASTVQEQWLHSSMDYTGYLADRLHQDGKLDAFNMLYQTDPDRAARMAASYLAETSFDAMPTPARVSTNLQDVQDRSPALSGKSVDGEHSRHQSEVGDGTASAYRKHQGAVRGHGYHQGDVANEVESKVNSAVDANMDAIYRQEAAIAPAVAAGKDKTADQLRRDAQIPGLKGPSDKPGPGSAAEHQDNVHRDLFGPKDDKKSKP